MNEALVTKIIELFEDGELEIVEEGDWVVEHKIDVCVTIVKYKDKYYKITQCRSGSYYSDYEYYDPEVCEVVPKEVTTIKWVKVK
jgi:hypothetical protein